jgi:hypothetical protein
MLEDFAAMEKAAAALPERAPLLLELGERFAVLGMHEQVRHRAVLRLWGGMADGMGFGAGCDGVFAGWRHQGRHRLLCAAQPGKPAFYPASFLSRVACVTEMI